MASRDQLIAASLKHAARLVAFDHTPEFHDQLIAASLKHMVVRSLLQRIPFRESISTLLARVSITLVRTMNVIGRSGLMALADSKKVDRATREELIVWFHAARAARWRSLSEVRIDFTSADQVGAYLIFNIRRNRYRLMVKYMLPKRLYIKALLTHREYDRYDFD